MSMNRDFLEAVRHRRSVYDIGADVAVEHDRVVAIVQHAILHTPSTFNSQSSRAVVLKPDAHRRLWDIVLEILRGVVPDESFSATEEKIAGFRAGAGTVMFFEDQTVIDGLRTSYPLYAQQFPLFSLQTSGMAQYIVWTALEDEGCGASLQHYNPLIDEAVQREWCLPPSWRLLSQLVYGSVRHWPGEKSFLPIEERVLVKGEKEGAGP
ncbi:MAG: nitroreductase [Pelodictyon luteolum]|uniref:Nitroreductase n=1 Tax=Pelodictyon luteolum TaxID=1100 RepID=A0A165ME65_PELLU|nr:MAG: nitroreductase [Pelodictyon luteolum]